MPHEAASTPQLPLANQLMTAVSRFSRVVTHASRIPISAVSMRALGHIERSGPQRISALACYESISQPAITAAVNKLEADGLVHRQPDPADARAQLVALTSKGRELLTEYRGQVAQVLQPRLDALSPDDIESLERSVEIFHALTDGLTQR